MANGACKFDVRTFGDAILVAFNVEAVRELLDVLRDHADLSPPMYTLRKRLRDQATYLEARERAAREEEEDGHRRERRYLSETDFDDEDERHGAEDSDARRGTKVRVVS